MARSMGPMIGSRRSEQGPRNLWEAMALLADLQHEQALALRAKDLQALNRLVQRRRQAWAYVQLCAERLAQRKEAPADLPERLRRSLRVGGDQGEWRQALWARAEVGERRGEIPEESRLAA